MPAGRRARQRHATATISELSAFRTVGCCEGREQFRLEAPGAGGEEEQGSMA